VPSSGFVNLVRNTFRNDSTQYYTLAVERVIPIPRFKGHEIELRGEAVESSQSRPGFDAHCRTEGHTKRMPESY
jgi:hypothetical protein